MFLNWFTRMLHARLLPPRTDEPPRMFVAHGSPLPCAAAVQAYDAQEAIQKIHADKEMPGINDVRAFRCTAIHVQQLGPFTFKADFEWSPITLHLRPSVD